MSVPSVRAKCGQECGSALEEALERAETDRDLLLSTIKQHRQATESRLRLLDSRGEAAKSMLKPDRDLYEAAERVQGS